jgi:hypothetical protein
VQRTAEIRAPKQQFSGFSIFCLWASSRLALVHRLRKPLGGTANIYNMEKIDSMSVKKRSEMKQIWSTLGKEREGWIPYGEIEAILAELAIESMPEWDYSDFDVDRITTQYCNLSTIMLAVECRWLNLKNKQVNFANETIYAFFAGITLSTMDFDSVLRKLKYQTFWRRIYDKNDLVAISMVAASKDPVEKIIKFANTDYLIAAKCITGDSYQVPNACREQVIRDLHAAMLQVENGGEWRSAYCAEQLRLIGIAADEIVPDIIETIKIMPITYVRTRLSNELVKFGKAALPFLVGALKEPSKGFLEDTWRDYIIQSINAIEPAA